MDINDPSADPAGKILDNLDAFAGVVVRILTGGAYPLSSQETRDLLQAEGALKQSTGTVRLLLDGGDDEGLAASGFLEGTAGRSDLGEALDERLIAHQHEISQYLSEFDTKLRASVQDSLNAVGETQTAQRQAVSDQFAALDKSLDERFAALEKGIASVNTASKAKGGKTAETPPEAEAPPADPASAKPAEA